MNTTQTARAIQCIALFFSLAAFPVVAQDPNNPLVQTVTGYMRQGDVARIMNVITSQESAFKKTPYVSYFENMYNIGEVLTGGSNEKLYWLGRKVFWTLLLTPSARIYGGIKEAYIWKRNAMLYGATDDTTYGYQHPEMLNAVRHDTFLMLSEYARHLNATLIPGYLLKPTNIREWADHPELKQNSIDNQEQLEVRDVLFYLPSDFVDYLVHAYSLPPRNDQELWKLCDILKVSDSDRQKIRRRIDGPSAAQALRLPRFSGSPSPKP